MRLHFFYCVLHFIPEFAIESNLRKDYGVIIVAIKKAQGKMIFNPQSSEVIEAGDIIVALGKKDMMVKMSNIL